MKAGSVLQSSGEERRRAPLDQLPPPANSNKPLTPFSIEDILNKPSVKKSVASICPPRVLEKVTGSNSGRNGISTPSSPLCALEELASKTFKGLEVSVIQAAEGTHFLNQNVAFLGEACLSIWEFISRGKHACFFFFFGELRKLISVPAEFCFDFCGGHIGHAWKCV